MKTLWLCGLLVFSALSEASEPIKDKEKFETEYIKCFQSGFANGCWTNTLLGHAVPWAKNELNVLHTAESAYIKWLDGKKIYKVYPGIKTTKAEIFESRSYVLERDDGAAVAIWVSYRQVVGKWYVHEVLGSSDDDFIRSALGITRPQQSN